MAYLLNQKELETEIKNLIALGLGGNAEDFSRWVKMEIKKKFKQDTQVDINSIQSTLDRFCASGDLVLGKFSQDEYYLSDKSPLKPKPKNSDSFVILGALSYSPLQYVKSRLEFFLKLNQVKEEEIVDISIATTEAVENAVKYGDGENVEINYSVEKKVFKIKIINKIKDFNLEDDIKRGKFTSTATLMRGMMVMQKLFDQVDLDIIEEKQQACFTAQKNLS